MAPRARPPAVASKPTTLKFTPKQLEAAKKQILANARRASRRRTSGQEYTTQRGVEIGRDFEALPGEVALAAELALRKLDIEVVEVPTIVQGFMGGEHAVPFRRQEVVTPSGEEVSIGIGTYSVAGVGKVRLQGDEDRLRGRLVCQPKTGQWEEAKWTAICDTVAEILPSMQIFKGQAIKVGKPDDLVFPRYINLDAPIQLILNPEVEEHLDIGLWSFIRHHAALKAAGIRVKRGVLMHGYYGTGKTSVAYATARIARDCGQTFLSITSNMASTGFKICQVVEPAVMFVEDLDEVTHGDRDHLNSLLNTLSGIESKECEVIVMTSTNFIDRIDPGFQRPERFDTIVEMTLPRAETVERVVRAYAVGYLPTSTDIREVCAYLAGATPAIIGEAVVLAKVKAVKEGRGIDPAELLFYARTLDRQKSLAAPKFVDDNNAKRLESSLKQVVGDAL